MRKILLYEHLTATCDDLNPLFGEGKSMLEAVEGDLRALAGIEVARWKPDRPGATLGAAARAVDAVFLIAPETGGVLYQLCRTVEQAGGALLGPSSEGVQLTGDKLRLAHYLAAACVPTPPCQPLGPRAWPYPQVCKPRDGAGSRATFLVRTAGDWPRCIEQARAEGFEGELVSQPYAAGLPASVSFLIGPSQSVALAPTRQLLSDDGRFHYLGSSADLPAALARRATALGQKAVAAVAGLRGYVGVDLVLGDSADGSTDQVIEINPRLTSSYLELRRFLHKNLMEVMLQVLGFVEPQAPLGPLQTFQHHSTCQAITLD